jgi:hypothetical protein
MKSFRSFCEFAEDISELKVAGIKKQTKRMTPPSHAFIACHP